MINKHKASDEEEDDIPSLSADEIEHEFMALLNTINPQYGDTIADEIAEILQMKKMGINVDALLLNVIHLCVRSRLPGSSNLITQPYIEC